MRFFKSIKFRLTVWYLVVIVALLLVFGAVAYFMLSNSLRQSLDESLKTRVTELQIAENTHAVFVERLDELVLIYNTNGTVLQRLGPNVQLASIDGLVRQALAGQDSFATTSTSDGQEVRLYAAPFVVNPVSCFAIVVGRPTAEIQGVLRTFRYILGISGLGVVILGGIGGLFLASRALKPVDRITRTAQDIGESDLSRRISVHSEDELGRLASTLNRMIERLDVAFGRQRQFTADASHELRTPLAVVQAESTLALSKERPEAEYRKSLELISQEAAYMSDVIGKLLFLARSDAGKEPLNFQDVDLRELLAEVSSDAEALAREKGLQFIHGPLEDLTVKGDRVKLRQLFLNLLDNAVRYTPSGGSISGSAVSKMGMAVVAISDTGIGIPPEHLPHIFDRFYRVDKARSRAEGGVGLGLAIAKYIAEVHGGKIEVESQVGKGSIFYVVLPLGNSNLV
jgi:heavy metal sensor kinase